MRVFLTSIKYTLYALGMVLLIFCGGAGLWIYLTDYEWGQFNLVLSLILKNGGPYSVLLVGVVITICFQIYTKEKEITKENQIKIKEVGYYTLAFQREEDNYEEKFKKRKVVSVIENDIDYFYCEEKYVCMIKFLTSKKESTNLKNVMAFGDVYFELHRKEILKDYYSFCEKIHYVAPLYCATKPTSETKNNDIEDKNRYFWLLMSIGADCEKVFWLSAVTEEGILLFIKVKIGINNTKKGVAIDLLQQTTYYKSGNKLYPLFG